MSRVIWGFTTRTGGTSEGPYRSLNLSGSVGDEPARVRANRQIALAALGFGRDAPVAVAAQQHGNRVIRVGTFPRRRASAGDWIEAGPGDALITGCTGQVLAVLVADCAPVLLADPAGGWVGAVHAGWRGLAAGVVEATVAAMCRESGRAPSELEAYVGPCIRDCCYEVGEEVARAVGRATARRGGRWRLDVAQAARARLLEAGLLARRVWLDGRCTACCPELFFSHRRDGPPTGRMAGLVAWTEA